MRRKKLYIVVSFPTNSDTTLMESACKKNNIWGKIIPVPRIIADTCGWAWCCEIDDKIAIENFLELYDISYNSIEEVGLYI